jgi:hypothetical protein
MTSAAPAGKAPTGTAPTGSVPAPRALAGRAVIWIGLALGTAATVLAVRHRIRIPGLGVVLSVTITWLLLIIVAVTVAELVRRHHRAAGRHAWRHGKRVALFAGRHPRRGARAAGGYLTRKAEIRWQARQRPTVTSTPAPTPPPTGAATGTGTPPPERKTTMADTKVVDDGTSDTGGKARPRPTRGRTGGGMFTAAWKQVISDTADFEPEDDGHLLNWMAAEVNGMSAYAEALTEVYETCVNTVGLDPVAMKATHDVADAAAEAAAAMAGARSKFAAHYSEVREFAANGGLLPFDGRWITGDGEA